MKIQSFISSTFVLSLLFVLFSNGQAMGQSSQRQLQIALDNQPSKATLQMLDPELRKFAQESIAILEAGSKIKDANSREAQSLLQRSDRNANALEAATASDCKKKCVAQYTACLAEAGNDFLARALCRTRFNWCIIRCHHAKKHEGEILEDAFEDEVGGGKVKR